jgi:hypothetical protein
MKGGAKLLIDEIKSTERALGDTNAYSLENR